MNFSGSVLNRMQMFSFHIYWEVPKRKDFNICTSFYLLESFFWLTPQKSSYWHFVRTPLGVLRSSSKYDDRCLNGKILTSNTTVHIRYFVVVICITGVYIMRILVFKYAIHLNIQRHTTMYVTNRLILALIFIAMF